MKLGRREMIAGRAGSFGIVATGGALRKAGGAQGLCFMEMQHNSRSSFTRDR